MDVFETTHHLICDVCGNMTYRIEYTNPEGDEYNHITLVCNICQAKTEIGKLKHEIDPELALIDFAQYQNNHQK